MIDLAEIVERIQARCLELGTTPAEVSAKATDSKDTIRNWIRALEADQNAGTRKASATTLKLNQIEAALGIELASNSTGQTKGPEARLRSALLAYGVDRDELDQLVLVIGTYVRPGEKSEQSPDEAETPPANPRRAKEPFE